MARTKTIDDILAEMEKVIRVWKTRPTFSLGADVTIGTTETLATDIRAKRDATEATRTTLTAQVNEQNAAAELGWEVVTRIRSGLGAAFGKDSSEYEQAGGTRSSERKKAKPKKKPS